MEMKDVLISAIISVVVAALTGWFTAKQSYRKEIKKTVTEHPNYPFLLDMKPMGEKDVNYQKKALLFKHPVFFAMKYRVLGVIQSILRFALKIPAVQRRNERRKHPLNDLP